MSSTDAPQTTSPAMRGDEAGHSEFVCRGMALFKRGLAKRTEDDAERAALRAEADQWDAGAGNLAKLGGRHDT